MRTSDDLLRATDADTFYSELEKKLAKANLNPTQSVTAIAAYFTQVGFRRITSKWLPPKRSIAIFWSTDSTAYLPKLPFLEETKRQEVRERFHSFFTDLLKMKPMLGPGQGDSMSMGIDVFVGGKDLDKGKLAILDSELHVYVQKFFTEAAPDLPALRFYSVLNTQVWNDLEHFGDAWIFAGYGSEAQESTFMYLITDVDGATFTHLSKSSDDLFKNPYQFASQALKLDQSHSYSFLEKRFIDIDEDGRFRALSDLWKPLTIKGCSSWLPNPPTSSAGKTS